MGKTREVKRVLSKLLHHPQHSFLPSLASDLEQEKSFLQMRPPKRALMADKPKKAVCKPFLVIKKNQIRSRHKTKWRLLV